MAWTEIEALRALQDICNSVYMMEKRPDAGRTLDLEQDPSQTPCCAGISRFPPAQSSPGAVAPGAAAGGEEAAAAAAGAAAGAADGEAAAQGPDGAAAPTSPASRSTA